MGRNCGQEAKRPGWTQDLLLTSYLLALQLMFDMWSAVSHTDMSNGTEAGSITRASTAECWWDGGGLRQNPLSLHFYYSAGRCCLHSKLTGPGMVSLCEFQFSP